MTDFDRYTGRIFTLATRELDVLRYASHGLSRSETADAMGLGMETVASYRDKAFVELRAKNITHAVAIALRLGLID